MSDDVAKRNRIRTAVTTFFTKRDCLTLPRPLIDEEALARLDASAEADIRPEFSAKVETLCDMVLGGAHGKAAKVKRLQGHVLSGRMLCTLLQARLAFSTNLVPA